MPEISKDRAEFILEYKESDRQKVFDAAKTLGCEVVISAQDELQLDIDKPWTFNQDYIKGLGTQNYTLTKLIGKKVWNSFYKEVYVLSFQAWKSRNGNTHVVLKLDGSRMYSDLERIIFQTVLGSDPVRELLNWKRVIEFTENPIALFRPESTLASEAEK